MKPPPEERRALDHAIPTMLTAHEIIGFMSPALSAEILEELHAKEKPFYRSIMTAVAEARKVRPVFFERKARVERNKDIIETLSKPRMEVTALGLLQTWLLKSQAALLADFLNAVGIQHQNGAVEDIPETMPDDKLWPAVEGLLAKHPHEKVAVYLRAFNDLNDAKWPNLAEILDKDARLQLCG